MKKIEYVFKRKGFIVSCPRCDSSIWINTHLDIIKKFKISEDGTECQCPWCLSILALQKQKGAETISVSLVSIDKDSEELSIQHIFVTDKQIVTDFIKEVIKELCQVEIQEKPAVVKKPRKPTTDKVSSDSVDHSKKIKLLAYFNNIQHLEREIGQRIDSVFDRKKIPAPALWVEKNMTSNQWVSTIEGMGLSCSQGSAASEDGPDSKIQIIDKNSNNRASAICMEDGSLKVTFEASKKTLIFKNTSALEVNLGLLINIRREDAKGERK